MGFEAGGTVADQVPQNGGVIVMNQTPKTVVSRVLNATAAGTSALSSTGYDVRSNGGGKSLRLLVLLGTPAADQATMVKLQSSDDNSTWVDVAGGATGTLGAGHANKVVSLEVYNPAKNFYRAQITRTNANCAIDGVIAIQGALQLTPAPTDQLAAAVFVANL